MTATPPHLRAWRRPMLIAYIGASACAFASTHVPVEMLPHLPVGDVALHAAAYGVLGSLLLLSLAGYGLRGPKRAVLTAAALAVYGAADELTQPWVGRAATWNDWLVDMLGIVAAIAVWETLLAAAAPRPRRGRHVPPEN